MNALQLWFMGGMTALVLIVVALLVFTDLADHLPTDPHRSSKDAK